MIGVKQTQFGTNGNCWEAVMASILECPLENVPFWKDKFWFLKYHQWLWKNYGLDLIFLNPQHKPSKLAGYHEISGKSERGLLHSCVGFNGEIVFDPHPDDTGLVSIEGYAVLLPYKKLELLDISNFVEED